LNNEELHDMCSSLIVSRMIKSWRMREAGYAARMEAKRNGCRMFVGKPEVKTKPGRLTREEEEKF
jgi:hypothetical protein